MISRRELVVGGALVAAHNFMGLSQTKEMTASTAVKRPEGTLIESHVHMISDDPIKFPFANKAAKNRPETVESFSKFAQEAGISHAIIVTPEPYQGDPSYMEYCLAHEPSKGFFKAICLFDPIDPATPAQLKALVERHPGRIVGMRIHELHELGTPSTTSGLLRDRDMKDPQMAVTWRAAHELGLGILIQSTPHFASAIGDLAAKFPAMPVMLDHLDRPGQGTPEEYNDVLKLAKSPNVYIKFTTTGVASASKEAYPHLDAKPLVKRVYEAFGPDRMMWGELGLDMDQFGKAVQLFDTQLDFVPESDRKKIRGLTAKKLYAFS
jgi:predicted TIM-barrel fold metal-dependent hydrolase